MSPFFFFVDSLINSKCLVRLRTVCWIWEHSEHLSLSTIFLVVLAWTHPFELPERNLRRKNTNLLVEDRLGLTTESGLLAVITTLALGKKTRFASLVLRDGVLFMGLAFLAKSALLLRETNLQKRRVELYTLIEISHADNPPWCSSSFKHYHAT